MGNNASQEGDNSPGCPLTAMQAAQIIVNLANVTKRTDDVYVTINKVETAIQQLLVDNAHKTGFREAASFWFRAGVLVALVLLGGALVLSIVQPADAVNVVSLLK